MGQKSWCSPHLAPRTFGGSCIIRVTAIPRNKCGLTPQNIAKRSGLPCQKVENIWKGWKYLKRLKIFEKVEHIWKYNQKVELFGVAIILVTIFGGHHIWSKLGNIPGWGAVLNVSPYGEVMITLILPVNSSDFKPVILSTVKVISAASDILFPTFRFKGREVADFGHFRKIIDLSFSTRWRNRSIK